MRVYRFAGFADPAYRFWCKAPNSDHAFEAAQSHAVHVGMKVLSLKVEVI